MYFYLCVLGNTSRYNWTISSGPGATEPNCTAYAYYSSVNFVQVKHWYSALLQVT